MGVCAPAAAIDAASPGTRRLPPPRAWDRRRRRRTVRESAPAPAHGREPGDPAVARSARRRATAADLAPFAGDPVLEACHQDKARLGVGARGEPVRKIQQALLDLGFDLGKAGADGVYGEATATAVRQFKAKEKLRRRA